MEETDKVLHFEHTLFDAEAWRLRKVDQKYLKVLKLWCWRLMEIRCTCRVRNEDVLHRVKEEDILAYIR
jgi:hypothetical protein